MPATALSAAEQRVLGCLIEKRMTTPDQYPLSLNALRLACNQSTNRDPIVSYDESIVRGAAQRLCKHGLARLASGHTSRAIKYRHLAEEALGIQGPALALLAVLLLRGPQTPGELKGRSERMARIDSLAATEAVLEELAGRGYVLRLDRRPGQKEDRFVHLFVADDDAPVSGAGVGTDVGAGALAGSAFAPQAPPTISSPVPVHDAAGSSTPSPPASPSVAIAPSAVPAQAAAAGAAGEALSARVAALEADVAALRADLDRLRDR
jgi:uncharacterized protein YceH (UPF0502 family)